jgi:hypothetical protein
MLDLGPVIQSKSFLVNGRAFGRMTVVRLLRWILFSISMVALTSLMAFFLFILLRLIFLAVF